MTAIRKKRNENGMRDLLNGSNPHSKGELFSRSIILFFDSKEAKDIITIVIIISIILMIMIILIIYPENFRLFDWKSNILLY